MTETPKTPLVPAKTARAERHIILASGSPRRLELVKKVGFIPQVQVSQVPEAIQPGEAPRDYTRRLARTKAEAVRAELAEDSAKPGWILAADTIVVLPQEGADPAVLEKPADEAQARAMLRRLSGRLHEVITSFCWLDRFSGALAVESVHAQVQFRELSDQLIARYVATGEPADKAGAYGIQDIGSALVRRIEGSYFAIVGLPVCEVVESLQKLGGASGFPWD